MQKHWNVLRTDNAGDQWTQVSGNLPSDFGFPIDVHAHEPETIYVVPITSDSLHYPVDGKLRVYRSKTGGNEWEALTAGLPQQDCYVNVLRDAMAVDALDKCGIYFGTTGGQVYASNDAGDTLLARAEPYAGDPVIVADPVTGRIEYANAAAMLRLRVNESTLEQKLQASRLTPEWSDGVWTSWLSTIPFGESNARLDVSMADAKGEAFTADLRASVVDAGYGRRAVGAITGIATLLNTPANAGGTVLLGWVYDLTHQSSHLPLELL